MKNIRKNKIVPILCSLLLVLTTSCEDYLDKQPTGDLTLDDVFANRVYAQGFLDNIYYRLPFESNPCDMWMGSKFNANPFVAGSDEMEIAFGGSYTHDINSGAWNPTNIDACNIWAESYKAIRECNVFLERLDEVPTTDKEKESWRGEATFLRAFNHFLLMRTHGPIVLLDHSLETDADFSAHKRAPIQEVARFIADDCNRAFDILKNEYPRRTEENETGRISAVAPLALQSRVLLYAASPLWNGNPDYAEFRNPDGEPLVPAGAPDKQLWQNAADAAKTCIEYAEANGYGLFYGSSADKNSHNLPANDPYNNYMNIWLEYYNKEWLFWKHEGEYRHVDQCADPLSFPTSASIYNPTQNIVDAYQMADGSTPITAYSDADGIQPTINPASGYAEDHFVDAAEKALDPSGKYYPAGIRSMYKGREPRFYASINFCLQTWKTDANGQASQLQFYNAGKDGKSRAGSDYCKTGYLMRKLVDETYISRTPNVFRPKNWVYFRMAEVYLNYAEALYEAQGDVPDVRTAINKVRTRAGLPNVSGDLQQAIHHERRIELAFETHRWFDARRWKETAALGIPITSMSILKGIRATDATFYERAKVEDRVFQPQHYLFPIPQDEININLQNLKQNPGWN
jgi:hypothetical protein